MANATKQYDPLRVIVTWGELLIGGFSKGSMITIEYDEEAVKKTIGGQGDAAATINANRGGKFSLRLMQVSQSNQDLSDRAASNRPRRSPLVIKPFQVQDLNGLTLAHAPEAWIQKVPNTEFADEHQDREWVLDTGNLYLRVGGGTI